jgi:hypothetical protein
MAFSRYKLDPRIAAGAQFGVSVAIKRLRAMQKLGLIVPVRQIIATGNDRLDSLAGAVYGDASYWWILAAASGIGWGLQIPPGTIVNVLDLKEVEGMLG